MYAGVAEPLVAEDIAESVAWVATLPAHVNIDLMVMRPVAQAAQHKVHRVPSPSDPRHGRGTKYPRVYEFTSPVRGQRPAP